MPGEEAIHVTMNCRNAAAVACKGDRADEARTTNGAGSARPPRASPLFDADEVVKPFGPAFAADESSRKVGIQHIDPAKRLEDFLQP